MMEAMKLARAGDLARAEALCRQEIAERPADAAPHVMLGDLCILRKDLGGAVDAMRRAVELAPNAAPPRLGLGNALIAAGNLDEGLQSLRRAAELAPGAMQVHLALGAALARRGDMPAAHVALRRAVDLLPSDPRACRGLGEQLQTNGFPDLAAICFERWASIDPKSPEAAFMAGGAYYRAREWPKAADAYRRSVARDPSFVHGYALLSETLERLGDDDGAMREAKRAIAIDPSHPTASLTSGKIDRKRGNLADAEKTLQRLLDSGRAAPRTRASVALELGHTLEGLGRYEEAFARFEEGQKLWSEQPNTRNFTLGFYPALLDNYHALVEQAPPTLWTAARPETRKPPIFFVGFPRSGTTLTEQILGAHPNLVPSDEPPFTAHMMEHLHRVEGDYPACLAKLSDARIAELQAMYWDEAERLLGKDRLEGRRLVDKLPLNICHLPLIRRVFPGAKVLVALRDPRDCCLSCFVQEFQPNPAMIHFYRLDTTARLYASVMRNWLLYRDRLGLDWMETKYEDLVDNVEAQARKIIAFLGEDWSDDVLRFREKVNRVVKTPSYQAVVQPINKRAVARWKKFAWALEPHQDVLKPFVEAFGYEPA